MDEFSYEQDCLLRKENGQGMGPVVLQSQAWGKKAQVGSQNTLSDPELVSLFMPPSLPPTFLQRLLDVWYCWFSQFGCLYLCVCLQLVCGSCGKGFIASISYINLCRCLPSLLLYFTQE